MDKQKLIKGLLVSTWVIIVLLCFYLLGIVTSPGIYPFLEDSYINGKIQQDSTDVVEFSGKLNSELKTFYNYNLSNIDAEFTEEELKEHGGVCWHYSEWYVEHAKAAGFKAKTIILVGSPFSHEVALIWDNNLTAYCLLDQEILTCTKMDVKGGVNGLEKN